MAYSARVVLDSISPRGRRLVTVEVTYPRFVHSELLTHRMLSRNSSSSRAIPVAKMIERVVDDPVMPVYWGKNQRGMQAAEELQGDELEAAKAEWLRSRDEAVARVRRLVEIGVHKQLANRVLEPWMWITVLISATEWDNFFKLRRHKDAQPEIKHAADLIWEAVASSTPTERQDHAPFIQPGDQGWALAEAARRLPDASLASIGQSYHLLRKLSVARCARVSFLQHDGRYDPVADLDLATRLAASGHWSPFEHVATAADRDDFVGNFRGWVQYRKMFAGESGMTR